MTHIGESTIIGEPQKQEQIVLERSARLDLDPGRGDLGDGGDK